ncbi:MAG: sporulation protein YabP [Oscillospiraceae bacterium]|nr:sporulation protein YabP [Oscillospiraceae bacterium]
MIYDERERLGSTKPHNLILEDRKRLSITGVEDVESFDEQRIILKTSKGTLIIRGSELHIDKLSLESGDLTVDGFVSDLGYEDNVVGSSIWSRLFK